MGKLKKGSTKVNPETQEIQYIPSRELSYEQLVDTAGNDIKKAVPGRYQARRDIFCILLEFQKDTGNFLSITEAPQSPLCRFFVATCVICLSSDNPALIF